MVTTADNERRRTYKRIWYKKKKANDAGDIYMVRFYEDALDTIRKIKHNPKAQRERWLKQAKHRAAVYRRKSREGYFRATSRRYRKKHHKECLERNRKWRENLSPQERAKRLQYHREYNRKHQNVINKRALIYARHNRERARKNSKRYYYNHKTEVIRQEIKEK